MQDFHSERLGTAALRGRRILVVEDELLVALETKALVWRFGGIVVGPYSRVAAALEAIQLHPLDGAILDVNVAGTTSFAVADSLQSRKVPFVFCSAYGRDALPPRYRNAPLVEKPLIPEALIAALVDALRLHAAEPAP